jgi:hypothetical protein
MSINFNTYSLDENSQILDKDILDIDPLMTSIEERPLLWKKTMNSYSGQNKRRKYWRDMFYETSF